MPDRTIAEARARLAALIQLPDDDAAAELERRMDDLMLAVHLDTAATSPAVTSVELAVQVTDSQGEWCDWRPPMPVIFPEEGQRQLRQARAVFPDRMTRLVRRTGLSRVEVLEACQPAERTS